MTVQFAAGTGWSGWAGGEVRAASTGSTVIGNCSGPITATNTVDCALFTGRSIAASETVQITFNGVTNPATPGRTTLTVTTSADAGKGKFRTKGQYSAATVRGTKWLVQDTCTTTLTRVTEGVVSVRDKVERKTITLRAGKSYTRGLARRGPAVLGHGQRREDRDQHEAPHDRQPDAVARRRAEPQRAHRVDDHADRVGLGDLLEARPASTRPARTRTR